MLMEFTDSQALSFPRLSITTLNNTDRADASELSFWIAYLVIGEQVLNGLQIDGFQTVRNKLQRAVRVDWVSSPMSAVGLFSLWWTRKLSCSEADVRQQSLSTPNSLSRLAA